MQLVLDRIAQKVGAVTHLYPLDLSLRPGEVTVLLGATQAGKTSLMRLMAGLDKPTAGRVTVDGVDVTHMAVRERNVAMVYQQFINYPSLTVADNIASPLKLRGGLDRAAIAARVDALARKLHIDPFLQRLPAELSGGQQQRVALARALAKDAPLMLLDEPLVNLDYKLREELREELTQLFAAGNSTVVYATTEPGEALLLGGWTAVMDAGEVLQYGPTAEVFHTPKSLRVARAFSDPPMNLIAAQAASSGVLLHGFPPVRAELALRQAQGDRNTTVRAELALRQAQGDRNTTVRAEPALRQAQGDRDATGLAEPALRQAQGDRNTTVRAEPALRQAQGDRDATGLAEPALRQAQGDRDTTVRAEPALRQAQGDRDTTVRAELVEAAHGTSTSSVRTGESVHALAIGLPDTATAAQTATLTVGVRAAALRVQQRPGDVALPGTVELAEISGSDTFVHVHTAVGELVAQLTGVHDFALGAPITLYLNPAQAYVFGADGLLLVAPQRIKRG